MLLSQLCSSLALEEELEAWDAVLQMIESQHHSSSQASSVKWKPIILNNLLDSTKHKPMCPSGTIEEGEGKLWSRPC